jgi:hypothetical protein
MKKHILVLVLPIVFACSCKTTKKAGAGGGAGNAELIKSETFHKPVKDIYLFKATTDLVPFDTVYITNDTLNILTKKVLGCDADNFKLIWNGDLGKAHPPQTAIRLFQLVDGACKERHKFHLVYNISPLKLKGDTASVKTTLIKIGGWEKMCTYSRN